MKPMALSIACAMALGACAVAAQDTTSHSVQFVTVQPDVNVEVVDFGGPSTADGKVLVLLAGLGGTAHAFDEFAPKLAGHAHARQGLGDDEIALNVELARSVRASRSPSRALRPGSGRGRSGTRRAGQPRQRLDAG